MSLRIDVRIDPEADRRLLAERAGDPVQMLELARRFDVEAEDAEPQRAAHFGFGLAHA